MTDEATPTDAIDKKDITYDILIDAGEEEGGRGGAAGSQSPVEDRGDHPAITILDMAVKQSGEYLKKQGLPPANNAVYESFSKPFLNTALWHYMPAGSIPDDPRVALALGVGGLGLAFLPTMLAAYQHQEEEKRREEQEKRRKKQKREEGEDEGEEEETKRIRNPVTGTEYNVGVPPHERRKKEAPPPGPDWMERLESTGLPGM